MNKDEREFPEVARFMEAKQRIAEFKEKHPKVFVELAHLVEEYNTSLEAASSAVRSTCESHGPFVRTKIITKYDADKLYDALGPKGFVLHGGVTQTVTKYSVNKAYFEAQAASGLIPADLVKEVKQIIPHYASIPALVLP